MKPEDVPSGFIRGEDARAMTQLLADRLAEIEYALIERITQRIAAGEDVRTVTLAEVRAALLEMDQLHLAFKASLDTKHSS